MSAIDTVTVENNKLVIKRTGQSELEVGQILAIETVDQKQVIYVDQLMHDPSEKQIGNYEVRGAISSIFTSCR